MCSVYFGKWAENSQHNILWWYKFMKIIIVTSLNVMIASPGSLSPCACSSFSLFSTVAHKVRAHTHTHTNTDYFVTTSGRDDKLDWHRKTNLYRVCQKTDLLTCNGIRCCSDLLLPFLNEHKIISRIPFRKLRLKNAYSSGLMAELK